MRILILVDCYPPSTKSGARMVYDLATGLSRKGHSVIVLTPSDQVSGYLQVRVEDGVRIARVKHGRIKDTGRAIRALREIRLSHSLWRRSKQFLLRNPSDLILFYSPTIFFSGLVNTLKRQWGCPAYLILRDIFPQWAVDAGLLKKGILWRFFRKKEIQQYEIANWIGVQSPANLEYFESQFSVRRFRLEVLYNWGDTASPPVPSSDLRRRLGLLEKVIFVYGGNIGVAQDMDNILRLAARLSHCEKIHFLLVGEGSERARLASAIRDQQLSNIQILPGVAHAEYLSMLSESDVGLISLSSRLKTHNLPGKLLGYMSCAKPTLASVNAGNDLQEILTQNEAGFSVVNGDDEGFCKAALKLADNPEFRVRMGQNAKKLMAQLFSVDSAITQILTHFQSPIPEPEEISPVLSGGELGVEARFPAKP